ncbi:alpha/beta-hydrolase [Clavulina sp. PMI_390]|nr:alpha/beta-hydrolase [Clavulina sp. PMI_390]
MGAFYEVVGAPLLSILGIYPKDGTFGRYLLPPSPLQLDIESRPNMETRTRRVFYKAASKPSTTVKGFGKTEPTAPLPAVGDASLQDYIVVQEGEDVTLTAAELRSGQGRNWVVYKTYELNTPEARAGKGRGCDVVLIHGMGDYGIKYLAHADGVLNMGCRVIIPDLPSHGRSTGVHVHHDSPWELTEGVHAILTDARKITAEPPRKMIISGTSLGGWTSLAYALRYPNPPTPLAGVWTLSRVLGRMPLAPAAKGNASDDPRVEADAEADPRTYTGYLRISTGFALLFGLNTLIPSASVLNCPVRIVHGSRDRVTDHKRSIEFINAVNDAAAKSGRKVDAACEIYDGYEHVMMKVGYDPDDDVKRQVVLKDMNEWMAERMG